MPDDPNKGQEIEHSHDVPDLVLHDVAHAQLVHRVSGHERDGRSCGDDPRHRPAAYLVALDAQLGHVLRLHTQHSTTSINKI